MEARFFVSALAACTGLAAVLLLGFIVAPLQAQVGTQPGTLTPDQQAIIAKIAKPSGTTDIQYAGKSTDSFGAEIRLPFQQGKFITLLRKDTTFRDDGSITWIGEVAETGERVVLMVWGNALLAGCLCYKGRI